LKHTFEFTMVLPFLFAGFLVCFTKVFLSVLLIVYTIKIRQIKKALKNQVLILLDK